MFDHPRWIYTLPASLIVWDEASMIHRYCLEALDKSLRDILRDPTSTVEDKPFGGKTIVLGGDFKQILLVIPSGSKSDILGASICNSELWHKFEVFV